MVKRFLSVILLMSFLLAAVPVGGLNGFAFFSEKAVDIIGFSRYILTFRTNVNAEDLLKDYRFKTLSADKKVYLVYSEDVSDLVPYCISAEGDSSRDLLNTDVESTRWENDFSRIPAARPYGDSGKGVTVAVLDTGVDRNHSELKNADIAAGFDAVKGTKGVYEDTDGHGTAVIGIIAASDDGVGITGVAPKVTIYPVKVSNGHGTVYSSDLIAGIYNAADNGANIINISLGGYSYSVSEQQAINYAVAQGCVIIAAAGNDGADASLAGKYFYPASYDGVISVASVDSDGDSSRFSQYNDKVDIAAPGRDITLCVSDNEYGYALGSGTSYSAAMVSGVAALAYSAAEQLNAREFEYLLISAHNIRTTPYIGHGVLNCLETVKNALNPIIAGIYSGAVLTAPTTVTFNRGEATLNGKPFESGEAVSSSGSYLFKLTDGDYKISFNFVFAEEKLNYTVKENTLVFEYGKGYLNGLPYVSGTPVTEGIHSFVLKGNYSTVSDTVNIGANAFLFGAEHGKTYNTAVSLTGYGNGIFAVNETPFSGTVVLSDGEYTATVTDINGNIINTVSFTVQTEKQVYSGFNTERLIFADEKNGYLLSVGSLPGEIKVYLLSDLTQSVRTFSISENIVAFESDTETLFIITDKNVYTVARNEILAETPPVFAVAEQYVPFGGYIFNDNSLYYQDSRILTTPHGNMLFAVDESVYTQKAIVNIYDGSVSALFAGEILSLSGSFALVKGEGLVKYSAIEEIAVFDIPPIVIGGSVYNEYTSAAPVSGNVLQTVFDASGKKMFMLTENGVYYTDTSFAHTGKLALRFVPTHIAAGGGKLIAFFGDEYSVTDTDSLQTVYYIGITDVEKALVNFSGFAAVCDDGVAIVSGNKTVYISDISVNDIAISANRIFIANSQGIGVHNFNGKFLYSIDSGDTQAVYTDGAYITSRDTVYLVADGSEVCRIPHDIYGITRGLVFTADGVYNTDGEKVSAFVYKGIFAEGYNISFSDSTLFVQGADNSGKQPIVLGGEGVFNISADIISDKGELYINSVHFDGGKYTVGGNHLLECVMPFGVIYSSEFSVIPALSGIAISGGDREISVGDSRYLLVEYLPVGASAVPVTFSVLGSSVTVDEDGKIFGVSEGVSVVTATYGEFSVSVKITVTQLSLSFSDKNIVFDKITRTVRMPAYVTVEYFGNSAYSDKADSFRFLNSDGSELKADEYIGTADEIKVISADGEEISRLTAMIYGDLDGNGMFTPADSRLLKRIVSGAEADVYVALAADLNEDGVFDELDSASLLSLVSASPLPQPSAEYTVNASVAGAIHPAAEFPVTLYVQNGEGIDSAWGKLNYNSDLLELMYVYGVNYELEYSNEDGVLSFLAYEKDEIPSDRVIKTFGVAMFRVKSDAAVGETEFVIGDSAVTANDVIYAGEKTERISEIKKRTAGEFSIKVNNAEYFVFNPSIRSYYVNVPYDAVNVELELDYPEGGFVDTTNTVIPESDTLTVVIRYTSPAGVSTDYRLYVTRSSAVKKSDDAYLSSLVPSVGELSPAFESERLKYTLNLEYDSPVPDFVYTLRHEKATVTAEIPESYPEGSTEVSFICVAEDGTQIKYTVTVVRGAKPEEDTSASVDVSVAPGDDDDGFPWAAAVIPALLALGAIVFVLIRILIRKVKNGNGKEIQ